MIRPVLGLLAGLPLLPVALVLFMLVCLGIGAGYALAALFTLITHILHTTGPAGRRWRR